MQKSFTAVFIHIILFDAFISLQTANMLIDQHVLGMILLSSGISVYFLDKQYLVKSMHILN